MKTKRAIAWYFVRILVGWATLSAFQGLALAQVPANVPCGLISWWKFDENAADVKGLNPGSILGGRGSFQRSIVETGWKSGGPGSLIVIPDSPSVDVTEFTLEMWVRLDAINALNMPLVWKGAGGRDITTSYALAVRGYLGTGPGAGSPGMVFATISDGSVAQYAQTATTLPIGRFKHITLTVDGENINIYIDGIRDALSPVAQTVIPANNSNPLQIGGLRAAQSVNYFNGVIDELTLYDRALDPTPRSEIEAIVSARGFGKCPE